MEHGEHGVLGWYEVAEVAVATSEGCNGYSHTQKRSELRGANRGLRLVPRRKLLRASLGAPCSHLRAAHHVRMRRMGNARRAADWVYEISHNVHYVNSRGLCRVS